VLGEAPPTPFTSKFHVHELIVVPDSVLASVNVTVVPSQIGEAGV
jgi:hypothetical protein